MKHVIHGKVTGHRLYYPDPQKHPDLELVKVELELGPPSGTDASKAKSKAVLLVDPDDVADGLQLGDFVQLVVSDSQQRLALADGKKHRDRAADGAEPR